MKKLVIFLIIFCYSTNIFTQNISLETGKIVATNWYRHYAPGDKKLGSIIKTTEYRYRETTNFYIFSFDKGGFVIVSANSQAEPILGYAFEGTVPDIIDNPAVKCMFDGYAQQIDTLNTFNLKSAAINPKWGTILNNQFLKSTGLSVGPLLKTKWGQSCYYNELCPSNPCGPCGHCVTGCVTTAMAQLMKYWNYPIKGKGSNTYIDYANGNISADFGSTTYQWTQMSDSLSNSNNAVATLMYHCAVAIGTGFGSGGSAGNSSVDPYINYFDYSSNAKKIYRINYTASQWSNVLKQELDLSRPVILDTDFSRRVGHSFVCDGYTDNDFFHFNWGWDGAANGYYLISASFSEFNLDSIYAAIIGLVPNHLPNDYKGIFIDLNAIDLSVNSTKTVTINSSSHWKAIINQSWVSLSTYQGNAGTSTLNITAADNDLNNDREATVIIEIEGFPKQVITVTQNKKINVTPGGLKNALSGDLATIKGLVIEGKIDARDFKIMRDSMPFLEEIDLSNSSIVAYTGTEGTSMNGNIYYEANAIPESAFQKGWGHISMALKSIKMPSTITTIRTYAFINCQYLESVNIPSRVTRIDNEAFMGTNIQTLNIPSSVVNCWLAFRGCQRLVSITVDPNSLNYAASNGILFNKSKTELFLCPMTISGDYYIPPTVNVIKDFAFESCNKITYLNLPISVQSIGRAAFQECRGLTSLSLPSSITSIGAHAFHNCLNLSSITASWLIPINLRNAEEVFYNVDKSMCKLYVPSGTASLYAAADQWKDFKNIVEMSKNQLPLANAGIDQSANEGALVILDGSLSSDPDLDNLIYKWTAPAGIVLSANNTSKPTFIAPEVKKDSVLTFTLVVNDGLIDSPPAIVKVTVKNVIKVGVEELYTSIFKVYPNPTDGIFTIESDQNSDQNLFVTVLDILGNEVYKKEMEFSNKHEINLSDLVSGNYLLKVIRGKNQFLQKLIIKK
jgi:hypothetical protein